VSPTVAIGLVLALGSSAAINWGYLAQHGAASSLPPLTLRHPVRSLVSLFSNLRWLAGFMAGVGGWVVYVVALALAPLSLVQAAAAGGIGLLALLVHRGPGAGLRRREWWAVWVSILGLLLLAVSLAGGSTAGRVTSMTEVGGWILGSLVVAGIAAGPGSALLASGAGLGIASGVLYAAGDVGTKAAVQGHGFLLFVPVVLACHGLAFIALQLGFQRGAALATAGVATLLTNALPIGAGVVLTRGTPVYDLVRETIIRGTADTPLEIPVGAVVVPGARRVKGDWAEAEGIALQTPVIVKYRDEKTDNATALESWLR